MSQEIFVDTYGRSHIVSKELSRGGQGIVCRTEDPDTLIKLEWDPCAQKIAKDASKNVKFGMIRTLPIMEKTNITLPQTILKEGAGYTMKMLDDMKSFNEAFSEGDSNYTNAWLEDMGKRKPEFKKDFALYISSGGIRKRIEAYLKAACILAKIHASGLVYCDVSDKNMFVSADAESANVWLIDCDNLDYMRNTMKKSGWRTAGFGAPEIYRGKGNTMYSDAYSFAIALFWSLTGKHPFVGSAVEKELENQDILDMLVEDFACSQGFPWIGDEDEDSQSGVGLPHAWMLSNVLLKIFETAFSNEAKNNRVKRVTMPEWGYILAKELDTVVRCSNCQMDYYAHDNDKCHWCDAENKLIRIKSGRFSAGQLYDRWEFVREFGSQRIEVPLRIINGFNCNELDEWAFRIRQIGDEIEISNFNSGHDFFINQDGNEKQLYGEIRINAKDVIKITSRSRDSGICCEIEIGV